MKIVKNGCILTAASCGYAESLRSWKDREEVWATTEGPISSDADS